MRYKRAWFDADCAACPRLAEFLADVGERYPDYHARPVPPFGPRDARLLIVGLAPGMHGANRTGRPFTGDHAGILLYQTLHQFGFSNRADSVHDKDGLSLTNCRITNAVKCLPPENKPLTGEVIACNGYLGSELADLAEGSVIIALGRIAHNAVLRAENLKQSGTPFAHGALHELAGNRRLLDSYHCSRYNTQTRRLTTAMFHNLFSKAARLLA